MSTEPQRTCPDCGSEFSGAMAFCPVCMLRTALDGEVEPGDSTSEDAVKPTAEPVAQRFENYELAKGDGGTPMELGRGAMGVTYKALDVDLHCLVTLKVISERYLGDESARLRFLREARAAASVRHPNVASVLHLGRTGSSYFYAMEFVEGETLESLIRRCGPLEVKLALEITGQVAAGLAAVHKQKLVHRDIKPSNIMVSLEEGGAVTAKIIDLGLAKGVDEPGSQTAISIPGSFAGTPEFASPEQFAGIQVDIRSDLYSLGVTLWKMAAGQVPFRGSAAEVMHQHQHRPIPLEQLKGVPQPIIILLEALLQKDPAQRFQTPSELLKAMLTVRNAIDAGRPVTRQELRRSPTSHSTKPQKGRGTLATLPRVAEGSRRRFLFWPVIALLVAGGLVVAANILWRNIRPAFDASTNQPFSVRSVAVLPFESLSDNKSDTYFADGVQGEILNNLAKVAQLKVISRTSVMQYRANGKRDLRQIADALGVANVVEGTVRHDGNRVRINAQLVDARSDNAVWADSYDRDLNDVFAIQSDVAQTIASKLKATLSPEEKQSIEAKPTENLDAYDLYLRAKKLIDYGQVSPIPTGNYEKPLLEAINFLEQAVRLDPKFTLAYCAAAFAHDELYNSYDPTPTRRSLGDAAINNALRLQPDLPEVHLRYAYHLYRCYRDYERARVHLAIARHGMPNNSEAMTIAAYMDRRQGNFQKAIQELNEAIELDPLNPMTELANTFCMARQFSACERAYNRSIELAPDRPILKVLKAYFVTYLKTGDNAAFRSALAALPASMAEDRDVLDWRLLCALIDRNWQQATDLIGKYNGSNNDGNFAYSTVPVPATCSLILVARLQGVQADINSRAIKSRDAEVGERWECRAA
jgi:serine/threonine protein kinase/tetratricopeptide (TPR) repeat protein